MKITAPPTPKTGPLRPEPPRPEAALYRLGRWLGSNQPDLQRNPEFWLRWLVYGPRLLSQTMQVARLGRNLADLGCGNGWLAYEIARKSPECHIRAIDNDAPQLEWGQRYYDYRRQRGGRLGEILYERGDLNQVQFMPGSLDVAILFFTLSELADPGALLAQVGRALRPGGVLVYYDGTEPSALNLERLARWRHRLARLKGRMSDLWNQQRSLENLYRQDAVRYLRHPLGPPEEEVFHALEEQFEVYHHQRTRAFLDLFLETVSSRRQNLYLPLLKALDDSSVSLGWLHGCCRFVLARQR